MIPESNLPPEESPRGIGEGNPADWNTRLQSAGLLYDQGELHAASALIWEADRIPSTAWDLALAARILAKDQPGKAIRLLTAVLENNRGEAVQNMAMANALLHHGMVLQAARFYGAALEINPKLVNLEFEHFFIWADDEQLLWGDFQGRRPQLHELPWIMRDPVEALELTRDFSRHTTPIAIPRLNQGMVEASAAEALRGKLAENPGDWDTRRTLAQLLHDQGAYGEAAVLIWDSDPIPSIDLDIAFAARALAREGPRKAIRLLTAVLEQNGGKAVQNMGVANALLHHGMVLEAARFYGAALDADPNLVNPDFEHFLLWTDDAKSLWGNFLKIRPPLGLFPWVHSDPALDFGTHFPSPPISLSELKQVQGENLTNPIYQQLARKNARITPPPSVTFPADRVARNDLQEQTAGLGPEEEAKIKAAAEAKAASLFAEAAESARTLIEQARQEATTEVAAIHAKAQEELQAAREQARRNTEQEMAVIRAKAREEAEAAAEAARKDAEFQAALIRAKAEEAAAQLRDEENARALALAKQRTEEEERSAAAAKQLAEEQANAAAEQAAAAKIAAEKARQEAISEVAAMHAKAQEELKATLEQARQNSEQEMAAARAKAKEEAESEAALIRTKAEENARAAEKARLEALAQAEAAAKLRAEEDDRALALAKQRAEEEERAATAAKRLAEEQARAAAEKLRREAVAEVAAIRAKAEEDAKKAAAAAEQARLEAAAQAKVAAEILARAEEEERALAERKRIAEEQAQAAAQQARQEALAEIEAIKAQAQEELKTAAEQARLNSEKELQMLRAKAREESRALMENAVREAASEMALISPKSEENAKLGSSMAEGAPPAAEAIAAAVIKSRAEQERAIPVAGTIAKEPPDAVEMAPIRQQGGTATRRFGVLLVSAAAALGVWQWIPGTPLDRAAFSAVGRGFVNGPLFVSGQGTHASPWKVRAFSSDTKPDKRQAPVIVSLGDDLEGFFKSSPPAPIDMAVVFKNFQRLGAKKAATAAVLAWETPDAIELAALEKSLDRFDALAMAAPLSRGAVSSSMPPAFRRASIPVTAVHGDISALPMVNRISIPGVILGGEKTSAGFSALESELPGKFHPLMARWEDRVVLSFPLLTVLQRFDLPPDGMEVRLGEFLRLGPNGPIVPIDRYGRLELPLKPLSAYAQFPAEALIDGGEDLFPKQAPDPVILRDDRSAAEPGTKAFSKSLSAIIAAISSEDGMGKVRAYPRLEEKRELWILGIAVVVLTVLCGLADFSRNVAALVLAGICAAAQWIGFGTAAIWLPGLPVLAAVLAMVVVAGLIRRKSPLPAVILVDAPVPEIEIQPEPVILVPLTEMAPAKKAAAKKTAAKKGPAKKAASTKTTRTKKSGGNNPKP